MTANFELKDAQLLLAVARRAPLENMDEAELISELLSRFAEWYRQMTEKTT